MFTGIVEEVGRIEATTPGPGDLTIRVRGPLVAGTARRGDSICVSGACLTVTSTDGEHFTADVMPETLTMTTLGDLAPGDPVNLERALPAHGRLDGHIVQGHVDAVGEVLAVGDGALGPDGRPRWRDIRISLPRDLAPLVAGKGSIALEGVSLTVTEAGDDFFAVSLIPATLAATTLGGLAVGQRVNIETDILARHVARLLAGVPKAE